ncbi:hypothetical protein J21TS7_62080 [Paenibacillus cineris]|uniref:Uncharacterized protein n=1 Tax=Paenibacillus cineris TaxID=237530 RepID=A0ABQ4LNJ8_9BACL|nr:hypothetical protein J21TS7_62080 [Paenibacillus cineris]
MRADKSRAACHDNRIHASTSCVLGHDLSYVEEKRSVLGDPTISGADAKFSSGMGKMKARKGKTECLQANGG